MLLLDKLCRRETLIHLWLSCILNNRLVVIFTKYDMYLIRLSSAIWVTYLDEEEEARACAWAEILEFSLTLTAHGATFRIKGKIQSLCPECWYMRPRQWTLKICIVWREQIVWWREVCVECRRRIEIYARTSNGGWRGWNIAWHIDLFWMSIQGFRTEILSRVVDLFWMPIQGFRKEPFPELLIYFECQFMASVQKPSLGLLIYFECLFRASVQKPSLRLLSGSGVVELVSWINFWTTYTVL